MYGLSKIAESCPLLWTHAVHTERSNGSVTTSQGGCTLKMAIKSSFWSIEIHKTFNIDEINQDNDVDYEIKI